GHNEGDDPTMTQPIMYARIKNQPTTRELYAKRLIEEGVIDQAGVDAMIAEMDGVLDAEFEAAKTYRAEKADWLDGKWSGLGLPKDDEQRGQTGVAVAKLHELGRRITDVPKGFDIHKTVGRTIANRRQMA